MAIRPMLPLMLLLLLSAEGMASPKVPVYKKGQAYESFTLAPTPPSSEVLLINMEGKIVHRWNIKTVRANLLKNCNLLAIHEDIIREFNWDGEVVWEWKAPKIIHHDFQRLENGNTLIIYKKNLTHPPQSKEAEKPDAPRKLRSDVLQEVTPEGNVVWEWHFDEHLDYYNCGANPCGKGPDSTVWIDKVRDWTHANTVREIPENKWYDAGDTRFKPGNIITMPRNMWKSYIIDKETKKPVWEYSGDYKGGLKFPHESHMIPKGYRGAGNILIFDNGDPKRWSYALEINPVTKEVVWVYENGRKFFSHGHGSLTRLPNGNTLISEDFRSRTFEVTSENEIVWKAVGLEGLRRATKYPRNYCKKLSTL